VEEVKIKSGRPNRLMKIDAALGFHFIRLNQIYLCGKEFVN
jgi:hypothetical protein